MAEGPNLRETNVPGGATKLCKYRESGCPLKLSSLELADHHKVCKYRPLKCPVCDKEVPYNELLDHLRNEMGNAEATENQDRPIPWPTEDRHIEMRDVIFGIVVACLLLFWFFNKPISEDVEL